MSEKSTETRWRGKQSGFLLPGRFGNEKLFPHRNKFTFDENDDQSPLNLSRQQSSDFHNDSSSANSSPKILKRQAHLIKRSSSELDPEEQATSWHNLPKEVWKTSAEVNSPKLN
jgi:hypothetical protein